MQICCFQPQLSHVQSAALAAFKRDKSRGLKLSVEQHSDWFELLANIQTATDVCSHTCRQTLFYIYLVVKRGDFKQFMDLPSNYYNSRPVGQVTQTSWSVRMWQAACSSHTNTQHVRTHTYTARTHAGTHHTYILAQVRHYVLPGQCLATLVYIIFL